MPRSHEPTPDPEPIAEMPPTPSVSEGFIPYPCYRFNKHGVSRYCADAAAEAEAKKDGFDLDQLPTTSGIAG